MKDGMFAQAFRRTGGMLLVAATVFAACEDSADVTGPDGPTPPTAFNQAEPGESHGIYRIPYGDGLTVTVTLDEVDETPTNRVNMVGAEEGYEVVAAASGTIRAIVDRHGNAPGEGDGLSADGTVEQDDALEQSCTDDETVEGVCSDYNNYVWIEHPNGEWTRYSHLGTGSVTALEWEVGDWIEAGQVIGVEGDVGAVAERQLQFAVGVPADPESETPFAELGGFMAPDLGVNQIIRTCDIPDLLYEDATDYTANPCENEPPVADAGGPYEIDEGTPSPLDGSGSFDPEGLPLTYLWEPGDNLDDPSAEMPVFTAADDGEFALTLTVYDQVEALSDSDETTVTVLNVAPTVTIAESQVTEILEGETLAVNATFSDPGVLDQISAQVQCYDVTGYSLTVEGTVEITSEEGVVPLTGTVTAECPFGDTSQSGEPPAGSFAVTVTVSDDDGGSGEASFDLTVANVNPTAVLDLGGALTFNDEPTIVTRVGEMVALDAQVTDPGSDDLVLDWDWDDGSTTQVVSLLDDPNPDPFPSPSVDPRDLMDSQSYAFARACLYRVSLTATDDDGGSDGDGTAVVITGDADNPRGAGFWMTNYRQRPNALDDETLGCYLAIVGHMSEVFDEITEGTSGFEAAVDVLWTNDSRGDMRQLMERHLMTAWLNFAHGAFGWDQLMDTDGDGMPDTTFSDIIQAAEDVRLDEEATRYELEEQKDILEYLNESGSKD